MSANAIKAPTAVGDGEQQEPDRRVSVLLTAISAKAYSVLRNLLTPAKPSEKSYDDLKEALRLHFKPRALVIAESFRFYSEINRQ